MLDDLNHFVTFLQNNRDELFVPPVGGTSCGDVHDDYRLHCSKCGAPRSVDVLPYWWTGGNIRIQNDAHRGPTYWSASNQPPDIRGDKLDEVLPSLYKLSCRQCGGTFTALIYSGPDGPDLVILSSRPGGLSTPNTPLGVAYYLDQAQRSHSLGANSAAVAMYRAALECLLFQQGYEDGMLGKKIGKLSADREAGKAPEWANGLEIQFLEVIKELGDGAIHPNDGDIKRQSVIDGQLIGRVQNVFRHLLDLVYESPHRRDSALKELKTPAGVLKR